MSINSLPWPFRILSALCYQNLNSGQHRGEKGVQVVLRGGGAKKAGRVDQGLGLGRQPAGVGGQMKFRVSEKERAYLP